MISTVWSKSFPSLTTIPVTLGSSWRLTERRQWDAIGVASEPVVALAFLFTSECYEWIRSERTGEPSVEVNLSLDSYEKGGMDTAISFIVNNSQRRGRSILPSSSYKPLLPEKVDLVTGKIMKLGTIEGQPYFEIGVLLIARRDVKVRRKGIWYLKEELARDLLPPWKQILQYSRTGNEFLVEGSIRP